MTAKAIRRISTVVPMYNEERHIVELYKRLVLVLEPLCETFEIICVDDGSNDETFAVLKRLHDLDRRVRVLRLSRNFGKECAMTAGLDFCRADFVVVIDADLQHPPECIPAMISRASEGYDVVYAVRRSRQGQALVRRLASDFFHTVMRRIGSIDIVDGAGDFRVMRRKVVVALRRFRESQRYMKGLFAWVGFRTSTIEFDQVPRVGGGSRWPFRALVRLAVEAITSFSSFPLRAITYLGLSLGALTLAASGIAAIAHMPFGALNGVWIVVLVILAMSATQLICLGIVAEYVGRSYNEGKRRPIYLVRDTLSRPGRGRR